MVFVFQLTADLLNINVWRGLNINVERNKKKVRCVDKCRRVNVAPNLDFTCVRNHLNDTIISQPCQNFRSCKPA